MNTTEKKPEGTAQPVQDMKDRRYYVTFGQMHPLSDGYVMLLANTEELAREEAFRILGQKWASFYSHEKMDFSYFPAGQYGKTVECAPF